MALKISFLFKRKLESRTQSRELKISSGGIDQREPDSDAKVFGLDQVDLRSIRLNRTSFPLKGSEKKFAPQSQRSCAFEIEEGLGSRFVILASTSVGAWVV